MASDDQDHIYDSFIDANSDDRDYNEFVNRMRQKHEDTLNEKVEIDITRRNKGFFEGLTYDEWKKPQDKKSMEFKAIETIHKLHPEYNLERCKEEIYQYFFVTYKNQKIHKDYFGIIHSDPNKLNQIMDLIISKIYNPDLFKSSDKKGHGAVIKAYLRKEKESPVLLATRIEEGANRQIEYLIQHKYVDVGTKADFLRKWVSIGATLDPIICNMTDQLVKQNSVGIKSDMEKMELANIDIMIEKIDETFRLYEDKLDQALHDPDNDKEELEEIRNKLLNYISSILNSPGNNIQRGAIRRYIKEGKVLFGVLNILERSGLISREYNDTLREKGIAMENIEKVKDSEIKDKYDR